MKKLLRNSQNEPVEAIILNGVIPEGFTEIEEEDLAAEEMIIARSKKMSEIRTRRDSMLKDHDKQFLIAQKTSADTTQLLADYQILLDIPQNAELALDALNAVQDIKDHDAFANAGLAGSYE